jgi:hypothetical protein
MAFAALKLIDLAEPEHTGRYRIGAACALVLAAGLSELFQRLQPTRDPSFTDFAHDLAGVTCTFLFLSGRASAGGPGRTLVAVLRGGGGGSGDGDDRNRALRHGRPGLRRPRASGFS